MCVFFCFWFHFNTLKKHNEICLEKNIVFFCLQCIFVRNEEKFKSPAGCDLYMLAANRFELDKTAPSNSKRSRQTHASAVAGGYAIWDGCMCPISQ